MARLFRIIDHDAKAKKFVQWGPFGLSFLKPVLYRKFGGRPALYLDPDEYQLLVSGAAPASDLAWRVVTLDYTNFKKAVNSVHQREWRTPGDVDFSILKEWQRPMAIVNQPSEVEELLKICPPGDDSPIRARSPWPTSWPSGESLLHRTLPN